MKEIANTSSKKNDVKTDNSVVRANKAESFQSRHSPADQVLHLQRTIGNQAVGGLIESGALQAKLKIGQPGDRYEQEADRVADQVMRMPEFGVQRQPIEEGEEEQIQAKPITEQITPLVQRQVEEEEEEEELLQTKGLHSQSHEIKPDLTTRIQSMKGGGHPLPESARSFFEPRFGHDFSQVRVHSGAAASQSARELNANAYTMGHDIVFGPAQFLPGTHDGRRLIAHELAHVVQQRAGAQRVPLWIGRQVRGAGEATSAPLWQLPVNLRPTWPLYKGLHSPTWSGPLAAEDELRFTFRSFDSSELKLTFPKQACHQPPSRVRLPVEKDRRVTESRLIVWALEVGTARLLTDSSLLSLQMMPGSEGQLIAELRDELVKPVLASHEFEGSEAARKAGAEVLALRWEYIRQKLHQRLATWFGNLIFKAIERTPVDAVFEFDPRQITRIVTQPYRHATETGRWGAVAIVGQRYGARVIEDIYQPRNYGGAVWFSFHGYPWRYYVQSTFMFRKGDPFVAMVATQVAEQTVFARDLYPWLIKAFGFTVGFSARLSYIIAGIVIEEVGEEVQRDVRGQPRRSTREILTSAGTSLLIDRLANRLFGGGSQGAAGEMAVRVERELIERIEPRAVKAIQRELVDNEAHLVARELRAGAAREVNDPALQRAGYIIEVEIASAGQRHFYRQLKDGRWCRFSRRICNLDLGGDVANAARSATEVELEVVRATLGQTKHELEVMQRVYNRLRQASRSGRDRINLRLLTAKERDLLNHYAPTGNAADLTLAELRALPKTHDLPHEYAEAVASEARLIEKLREEARPLYDKMRAASPRESVRQRVLKDSRGLDAASRGSPRSGKLAVDHVVPVREIVDMPGFAKLDFDEQVALVNDMKNLRAIDSAANSSRGARPWSEWPQARAYGYKQSQITQMGKLEMRCRQYLQKRIRKWLVARGKLP